MKKLVYGVGLNDAEYVVNPMVNGVQYRCPFYDRWKHMLERCYSASYQYRQPTYIGCSVCDDWLVFSKFKQWMQSQDWKGKELDKDIICKGNKVYSPDYCVFIDKITNTFTVDKAANRGSYLIGVSFDKSNNKFVARCNNPFTKIPENLGCFSNETDAHFAWKKRKLELAFRLAAIQQDCRVAAAIINRYS